MKEQRESDFQEWVKFFREKIFARTKQQFGEMLDAGLKEERKNKMAQKNKDEEEQKKDTLELGDRYIGVLENRASTIRIDVLEYMLKLIGVDFAEQKKFYEYARKVAQAVDEYDKTIKKTDKSRISIVEFIRSRQTLGTKQEHALIKRLDEDTKNYIYNLVNLNNSFYGRNRLVDMQSINYFWSVAVAEYYILTQKRIALTTSTAELISNEFRNILIPLVDECEYIFTKTATERKYEGMQLFKKCKEIINNYETNFTEPKSKKEQLEYQVKVRTLHITSCLYEPVFDYLINMRNIINDIYQTGIPPLLAKLNSWSGDIEMLAKNIIDLFQTGVANNSEMMSAYNVSKVDNHLELIYKMSIQINILEGGSEALKYVYYILPKYDEKLLIFFRSLNDKTEETESFANNLSMYENGSESKNTEAYANLKTNIVDYLYENKIDKNKI